MGTPCDANTPRNPIGNQQRKSLIAIVISLLATVVFLADDEELSFICIELDRTVRKITVWPDAMRRNRIRFVTMRMPKE